MRLPSEAHCEYDRTRLLTSRKILVSGPPVLGRFERGVCRADVEQPNLGKLFPLPEGKGKGDGKVLVRLSRYTVYPTVS